MRYSLGITTAASLLISATVLAGDTPAFYIQTKKVGNQSITTLKPVFAPAVKDGQFKDATAQGRILEATDWSCGHAFTDEEGRRWCLVYGPALREMPPIIPGWLIQPRNRHLYFFTIGGSLFRQIGPAVALNVN